MWGGGKTGEEVNGGGGNYHSLGITVDTVYMLNLATTKTLIQGLC